MKKQNLQKELYPILENESIQIGAFKANRSIDTLDFIRENIKFWKSYDGHKLPEKQVKRAYYNGTRTQNIIKLYRDTPELIKFVILIVGGKNVIFPYISKSLGTCVLMKC